ncbi:hypothetical protein CBL_20528, partial [Carabus blaptoides fortunei]
KNDTLIISTLLDARFKNLAFSDPVASENAKKIVTAAVSEIYEYTSESGQISITEADDIQDDTPKELSIWSSFDTIVSIHKPRGTSISRAIMEVQRYLEDDVLP